MSRSRPGRLDDMLSDGTLYQLAQASKTQADLARQCGITPDAWGSWMKRRKDRGLATPTFEEMQRGRGYGVDSQKMAAAFGGLDRFITNCDKSDFSDEEPTQPGMTSPWGAVAGLPPVTFAANDEQPGWSYPEAKNDNWRAREHVSSVKKLTRADLPDGSLMLLATDMHFPIENTPVVRLMVEAAERHGVKRVTLGGDILDMNCLSKHAKESARTVAHATVLEEVEPARWFLNWAATKPCDYLLGNHEDRLKRFIDENPAFHGSLASNLGKMCDLPPSINVLDGEVRIGNLSIVHGHHQFKNGSGGKYPAQRLLDLQPDQSTVAGHVHRQHQACRTTRDEDGIKRTRRATTLGHLSHEHMHYGYVSSSPNWQTGFAFIRFWWDDDRPRWSLYPIEVLFDRHDRPYFEFNGIVHR